MDRTGGRDTATLNVQMKMGILDTIANSIYSDPKVKIREAVANSMDNGATWFIVYADRPSRTITLIDNGTGIKRSRFNEIFESLGCGMGRENIYSSSFFGLGILSILAFGEKATIFSKSESEREIIKLEIDSAEIFGSGMRDKPISEVSNLLTIGVSNLADRERLSILSEEEIRGLVDDFPGSFTEIILEKVDRHMFDQVTAPAFETELRKILPLKVQKNEPFLTSVKDDTAQGWMTDMMSNPDFCPTVDVYFGVSDGERELGRLWKYFPNFRTDLEIGSADIAFGFSSSTFPDGKPKFAYYYMYSVGDLEERGKKNTETGFWVRNKNFLIKEADYFQKPGSKKKIMHEPLKNWLFGEIFHRDMTNFLVVTRNEWVWEKREFVEFFDEVKDLVDKLNERLRVAWRNSKEIEESIVLPFTKIKDDRDSENPFRRSYTTLVRIGIIKGPEDVEKVLNELNERRRPEMEAESKRIDRILAMSDEPIVLADDEYVKVVIDPRVTRSDSVKRREPTTDRIIVRISPAVFAPVKTVFLNKSFDVYYVAGEKSSPGISVDVENRRIFVNPFNQDISKYSVSFVEICIAAELADIYSETKAEMKSYLLELLGAKLTGPDVNPGKYLFSLKDELQRRYGNP